MKMLMALVTFLIIVSSHAVELRSAQMSKDQKSIELIVKYQVDGARRFFGLKNTICQETFPVQCLSELDVLVEGGSRPINRFLLRSELIHLADEGLDDPYFRGASITIKAIETDTSVTLYLP